METSEKVDLVAPAFVAAQADLESVTKAATAAIRTRSGASYDYQFASFPDVQRAVLPVFAKHGLAILQGTAQEDDGGFLVESTVLHTSGQWLRTRVRIPLGAATAQGAGSAFGYGRRIGMVGLSGVITDDLDDDGAKATTESAARFEGGTRPTDPPAPRAGERVPLPARSPAPPPPPSTDRRECPDCHGAMWDNRVGKRNPKAPDFKCKDAGCGKGIWLGDEQRAAPALTGGGLQDHPDDVPFPDDNDGEPY